MTGGVNHKIFINYRRGDDPGFTTALYMHLEEKFGRSSLFMDVEGHIKPGDDFVEVLQNQVSQCEVLLVVIGPRWTDLLAARLGDVDDFVAVEIEAALNQRKKVIPVLVGGAIFPRAAALPDRIRGLARKNAVDLRPGRFKTDCESLTAALNDAFASMKAEASASKQTERSAAEPASERHEMPRSIGSATPERDPVVERGFGQIQDKKQAATLPLIGVGDVEASTAKTVSAASRKIAWRLIPFLMLCYFVAYLDRVNLGFAALTLKADLGFSDAVFGLGAGIFFAGYFIFEVPSNILLEKVGARIWIARIMVTWGILSAAMAFVQDEMSFYIVRFLLGVAEAGFFPGIILYLTYWYTSAERAKMVGLFMVAIALSGVIGAPLSGFILTAFAGVSGLKSWQWLFILEAAPAIILGIVTYFYLTDKPAEAKWLKAEERSIVSERLAVERASKEAIRTFSLTEALTHPRILALALVYFGVVTGLYGLGFWLPQIVKAFGLSTSMTGWVVAIPYVFSAIIMVPWTRHSDRTGERVRHVAIPAFLGGTGLIAGAYLGDPVLATVALTAGSIGTFAALPTFWSLPTALLTGTAAAGGIALINAIGNLGGFVGPYLVGWIRDTFKDPALATASLGGFMIAAGIITLVVGHDSRMEAPVPSARTA